MSNLVARLQHRQMQCQLAVSAAYQEINRQERIAKKDKATIPGVMMEKLVAEVKYCKAELASVEASLGAASKYPPLYRFDLS